MSNNPIWTESNVNKLKEIYSISTKLVLVDIFNCPWCRIFAKAKKLKLTNEGETTSSAKACLLPLLEDNYLAFYWIGFILADGHLNNLNRLTVTLSYKDAEHLLKFKSFLNEEIHQSVFINNGNRKYIRASITDKYCGPIIRDKFDISNIKTYQPPNLSIYEKFDDNLFLSLLVGITDGDGNVRERKSTTPILTIKLHSSWLDFLKMCARRLGKILNITVPEPHINARGYAVLQSANSKILFLLKQFYLDNNLPVLNRKWNFEIRETRYDISKQKRLKILELWNKGYRTAKLISDELNLPYNGIYGLLQKVIKENNLT